MKKMGVIAAVALVSGALWATDLTLSTREATVNVDGEYTLEQVTETGYSHLRFKMKEPFQPAKILSFEYRLDNPADFMYVATNLTSDTKKSTYNAFPPSAENLYTSIEQPRASSSVTVFAIFTSLPFSSITFIDSSI